MDIFLLNFVVWHKASSQVGGKYKFLGFLELTSFMVSKFKFLKTHICPYLPYVKLDSTI